MDGRFVDFAFSDACGDMLLTCPRCGCTGIYGLKKMLLHVVSIHSNEANFRIVCSAPKSTGNCCSLFRSASSYKTHIYRYHSDMLHGGKSHRGCEVVKLLCPMCGTAQSSLSDMASHYRSHIQHGLSVLCLVKRCHKTFSVFASYTSHMSRLHRNVSLLKIKDEYKQHVVATNDENDTEPDSCMSATGSEEDFSQDHESVDTSCITRNIALLFLKMKAIYCIPDATVQQIVDDIRQMLCFSSLCLTQQISAMCSRHCLSDTVSSDMCSVASDSYFERAMINLSTNWKRNAYYREHLPYVAPKQYSFTDEPAETSAFQYISLIDSLKVLLRNDEVQTQIMNPERGRSGHLRSFRDGTLYREHSVFSIYNYSLEIILYSDEFEVVNPLGPHKKKHKMMAFYFTLGNFHASIKSQKPAMLLLALCKSIDIQKHGFIKIAGLINSEIGILENDGLAVDGFPCVLHGALAFIAGDNLNSHLLGGFNASFSPNVIRPCRFCLISNTELQSVVDSDCFKLRTKQNYNHQVNLVQQDATLATDFGIRYKSSFISGSFHVVDGLPPDIMHDMLEGVVPLEMSLVLKSLIDKGYFTLDDLNHTLESWNYGPLDKADKPVLIANTFGESLKQNAGRTWCLLRLFPLMVGSKVPQDDPHWQFVLSLKDIVEIVLAPSVAVGHVLLLQHKIHDHIAVFQELFPSKALKPKQHFMLHYWRNFLVFGPLRLCWCMRFESKHCYFTRMMKVVNNYKNACATLAERHQMYLAYLLSSDHTFLQHDIFLSATVEVDVNYLSDTVVSLLSESSVSLSQPLHQCQFVKVNGIPYHCHMYAVLDVVDDIPLFGRIDAIYVQHLQPYFLLRVCKSEFYRHLSAYTVEVTEDVRLCAIEQLLDYYPLSGYILKLKRFVVLKNFVYDHKQFDI